MRLMHCCNGRFFLERQDTEATAAGSSFEQFHRTLEAVKAYGLVFIQLYLEGHRDFRVSNLFSSEQPRVKLPLSGPNALGADDINAKRDAFERVLVDWRDGIMDLRDRFPFLNYFTAHQLTLLVSDILDGRQQQHILGTLKFIRKVTSHDISTWSDLLNDGFKLATAAAGATTSSIALRLLERLGEMLDLTFENLPETFREVDEDMWVDISHRHGITPGEANVCVSTSPVETLISLYAPLRRLPQASEVLFCDASTTIEQIKLWIRRAFDSVCHSQQQDRLFSLVYADALSLELQLETTTNFKQMLASHAYSRARGGFQVIFLCSQHNSLVVDVFRKHECFVSTLSVEHQRDFLRNIFPKDWPSESLHSDANFVLAFASDKVGLGKSFRVSQHIGERIGRLNLLHRSVQVPLGMHSGDLVLPLVDPGRPCAYHLNLCGGSEELDILMFKLLVLNDITDSLGRHFCVDRSHGLYVELPSDSNAAGDNVPALERLRFCNCLPQEHIELTRASLDKSLPYVQLPLKYLDALGTGRLIAGKNGPKNAPKTYVGSISPMPAWATCEACLLKHLPTVTVGQRQKSVLDESMVLTVNFLKFLHCHLERIDNFVNEGWGGPLGDSACTGMGKPDFRHHLVQSFVETACDYSGRCISPFSLLPNQLAALGIAASDDARDKEFALMRKWSVRPMILPCMNPNGQGIVGYKLLALDPTQVPQAVKDYWVTGFTIKSANFKFKDYSNLPQAEGVEILKTVLGVTQYGDVPAQFVLTIDNILKMLAIYFRVASGIPVVIMGETGCGKTFSTVSV